MLLQPKLNMKVSQRQVLTPGLVQMVSVLALNKLELKEMINTEMVENPVLEELEESAVSLEERAGIEGDRERSAEEVAAASERVEKDPFDEIDFGSYFQDYLDPGFRTTSNFEEYDKPSFENFLSQPSTLSDHLLWQLGSLTLAPEVRDAGRLGSEPPEEVRPFESHATPAQDGHESQTSCRPCARCFTNPARPGRPPAPAARGGGVGTAPGSAAARGR